MSATYSVGRHSSRAAPSASGPGLEFVNPQFRQLQVDASETAELMRDNIHSAMLRGFKLEELEERSEHLEVSSSQFAKTTDKVRRKYWLRNKKWTFIIAGVILLLVIVIILVIVFSLKPWESGGGDSVAGGNNNNNNNIYKSTSGGKNNQNTIYKSTRGGNSVLPTSSTV